MAQSGISYRATPSTPQVGSSVTMTGQIAPGFSGRTVWIQQEQDTANTWKTVTQATTNASGEYFASVTVKSTGTRTYRARLVGLNPATSLIRVVKVISKPSASRAFKSVNPTVSGAARVGNRIGLATGQWTPTPSKFSYQWRRDGTKITGATAKSYVLTAADHCAHVTVEAKASRNSKLTVRESIAATPVSAGTFVSGTATISGDTVIGHVMTASSKGWSPAPDQLTYQWTRNQQPISGATYATYSTKSADVGADLGVTVVAHRTAYSSTSARSAPVRISEPPPAEPIPTTPEPTTPVPTTPEPTTPEPTTPVPTTPEPTTPEPTTPEPTTPEPTTPEPTTPVPTTPEPTTPEPTTPLPTEPEPSVPASAPTFGDLMKPESAGVVSPSVATVTFSDKQPDWFARNTFVRWDTPGAFAHSLDPVPYGTLHSAAHDDNVYRPSVGGEYHVNNSFYKAADVSFKVTGDKFAIRYLTYKESDAMLWIDGQPVATEPFLGSDPGGTGAWNWLIVSRTSSAPVTVRFAGPLVFSGVDHDSRDNVTVTATQQFTLGVVSDSMYEILNHEKPKFQNAGSALSTVTGFRVWNMAEGGTGYVNDGSGTALSGGKGYPGHISTPYGSDRRIATIAAAPIDALLVNGSLNDRWFSASAHREAMDKFLDRVAEVRPDLPVVLLSLEPLSYLGVDDRTFARYWELNANFASVAATHPNVVGVIDPFTADWITGTGSSVHPKGDGNQDQFVGLDEIHLNGAGQAYYQTRVADELRPMLARLPR
ncbi:hypothetical protein J2X11_002248 [Aeromicrobium panaciterrae]|uniref:SGNH hydrolase-type esterase domain-containing protein n=1 Tax=Aeromicrobium panaciterrae TaxID=363861 RepID=A0ABU1UQF3_9ACTN|nr:SGNH/GDSL hydrolase family protein [Aeromicrobium panaciterrae]MDR7087409.1 hypothetical protein [Aeromicrobium panaciterrae]